MNIVPLSFFKVDVINLFFSPLISISLYIFISCVCIHIIYFFEIVKYISRTMSRHTGAGVRGGWVRGSSDHTTQVLVHYITTFTQQGPLARAQNPPLPLHIQIKLATAQSNVNPTEKSVTHLKVIGFAQSTLCLCTSLIFRWVADKGSRQSTAHLKRDTPPKLGSESDSLSDRDAAFRLSHYFRPSAIHSGGDRERSFAPNAKKRGTDGGGDGEHQHHIKNPA